MRNRPPLLWIAAIGLLLLLAPLVILWRLTAHAAPLPIERFLPRRLSAALCLRNAQDAWSRHWTARQGPPPEEALKAVFDAIDKWPRWVEKYGELNARMRLKLYQEAFFQAVGEEAWLLFGEWGDRDAGQVGMVVFLRGDTPIRSRITPLMDLLLGDYKIQRTRVEGERVYEYSGKKDDRNFTFCQIGGWLCVSMRRSDAGPLPALIRQVRRGDAASSFTLQRDLRLEPAARLNASVLCALRPDLFWDELAQFNKQRGKALSKASRKSLQQWRRGLQGIDVLTLRQWGDSLFDLELAAQGPRFGELNRQLRSEIAPAAAPSGVAEPAPRERGPFAAPNELAQLEISQPLARLAAPATGFAWADILKDSLALDLTLPGLRARLSDALIQAPARPRQRIGLAAYPSPSILTPQLLFWSDQSGVPTSRSAPAQLRLLLAHSQVAPTSGAQRLWVGLAPPEGLPPSASAPQGLDWPAFLSRVWVQSGKPPLAFLSLNFRGLADELKKIPTLLMKKKARKQLEHWQSTLNTLALGAGGAAARLDAEADRWILTCRTP